MSQENWAVHNSYLSLSTETLQASRHFSAVPVYFTFYIHYLGHNSILLGNNEKDVFSEF